MALETVVVEDVKEGSNGWFEVILDDGRKASTKDKAVADAAFESRGDDAKADINTVVNGNFTNTYLNAINGVTGSRPKKSSGTAGRSGGGGMTPADRERVARQWAAGRAVELLIAGKLPLSAEDLTLLEDARKALLDATAQ